MFDGVVLAMVGRIICQTDVYVEFHGQSCHSFDELRPIASLVRSIVEAYDQLRRIFSFSKVLGKPFVQAIRHEIRRFL